MPEHRMLCFLAGLALAPFPWLQEAGAMYIKPAPDQLSDKGKALAADIADSEYPAVGIVIAPDGRSTGSLIGPDDPKRAAHADKSWVLTAGHSLTTTLGDKAHGDAEVKFQPEGMHVKPSPTELTSDLVRRYPRYDGKSVATDLGLIRLGATAKDGGGKAIEPLKLKRDRGAAFESHTVVGFGITSSDAFGGGFGNKRRAKFVGDDYDERRIVVSETGFGSGTKDDPDRQACEGDSGGPLLFGDTPRIGGVISGGESQFGVKCGQRNAQLSANTMPVQSQDKVIRQNVLNWIDSFLQKAVNVDQLEIRKTGPGVTDAALGPAVVEDSFEAGANGYEFGETGLPDGWVANDGIVEVPGVGPVGPNPDGWRYFNAIGTDNLDNPELYTDGESGLGAILDAGGYSIVSKTVTLDGGYDYSLNIQQSWNSGGLVAGVGVLLGEKSVWSPLWLSDNGTDYGPAQWTTRSLAFSLADHAGPVSARVVLLSGTVPEPGTGFLAALAAAALLTAPRRLRPGRTSGLRVARQEAGSRPLGGGTLAPPSGRTRSPRGASLREPLRTPRNPRPAAAEGRAANDRTGRETPG